MYSCSMYKAYLSDLRPKGLGGLFHGEYYRKAKVTIVKPRRNKSRPKRRRTGREGQVSMEIGEGRKWEGRGNSQGMETRGHLSKVKR